MKNFKNAFTMIELIFVIVVLGILSAVAFPKLSGITEDANYAQGMATVSSIRSGIQNENHKRIFQANFTFPFPSSLDDAAINTVHEELFDNFLQYPVYSKSETGGWMKIGATSYNFYMNNSTTIQFDYNTSTGRFDCDHSNSNCKALVE
jgi:general secretion pathway protein G